MDDDKAKPERPWYRLHLWQLQPVRDVLWLLAIYGVLHLGYLLSAITVPILLALGLSYLLEPLVVRTTRRYGWLTRPRLVASLLVVLVLSGLLVATMLVPVVASQVSGLVRSGGQHLTTALDFAESEHVPGFVREQVREFRDAAGRGSPSSDGGDAATETSTSDPAGGAAPAPAPALSEREIRAIVSDELARRRAEGDGAAVGAKVLTAGKAVVGFVVDVIGGAFALGFGAFLVGFFFFVFSTSWARVVAFGRELIPEDQREVTEGLVAKMDQAVSGFVRGRLTIAAILGVVFVVGWSLCGVPYAVVLGLGVGVFTLVPYLAGAGLVLAYGLLLVQLYGDLDQQSFYLDAAEGSIIWWRVVVFPGVVFVVAQLMDDYLLTPLIQGKATNLSMAAILVAVLAGGTLAGVYGMLLAIPLAACLKIVIVEVLWPRVQAWLRGERPDPLPLGRG